MLVKMLQIVDDGMGLCSGVELGSPNFNPINILA